MISIFNIIDTVSIHIPYIVHRTILETQLFIIAYVTLIHGFIYDIII